MKAAAVLQGRLDSLLLYHGAPASTSPRMNETPLRTGGWSCTVWQNNKSIFKGSLKELCHADFGRQLNP